MADESHRSGGIYRVLEWPAVYDPLMRLLGGPAARKRFVDEFVRPPGAAKLLDVGCGTGVLLDDLPPGIVYVGVDVNAAYIERARRRYGDRGEFFRARAGEDDLGGGRSGFDFVVAMALLHHLEDDEAKRLLDSAARLLRPGGAFVAIDPTLHERQAAAARVLVSLDRGRRVRSPQGYRALIETRFADIEDRVLTDLLPIPYSHYVVKARSASAR
jgi:SAM-dependent methyltransferase